MAQSQATLSPAMFTIAIEAAAKGQLSQASLVSNVQTGIPLVYGDDGASFTKEGPGKFTIHYFQAGNETSTKPASTPVEAKLLVLDHVIGKAKKSLGQPA
jgi:hypothetical protein